MIVKVQWIIDGVMEIDAETNEAAEALADEKLRSTRKLIVIFRKTSS